jgi:hypothetical protein
MRNIQCFYLCLLLGILVTTSCSKDEGYGGSSHIEGQLICRYYNEDFTVFQGEEPAKDEDIFLLFGDNKTVADDIETSNTGHFSFEYLWPGNYQLYYYSDDTARLTYGDKAIVQDVVLEKNKTTYLGKLYMYKALRWDRGKASITGRVMNFHNPTMPMKEEPVYIIYNHEDFYRDRIRTSDDGTFKFPDLLMGHYTIFVYSSYTTESISIDITERNQKIVLDTLWIN